MNNYNAKQIRRIIWKYMEAMEIARINVEELVKILSKHGIEGDKTSGNTSWMADKRSQYAFVYDSVTRELCRI